MEEKIVVSSIEETEYQGKDNTTDYTKRPVLTSEEAADYLRVCEKTLRNVLMKKEGFPWMQPAGKGGKLLFPRIPLDIWVAENWKLMQGL